MPSAIQIGIIGDFDPNSRTHPRTNDALRHAAASIGTEISITWIPTEELVTPVASRRSSTSAESGVLLAAPTAVWRAHSAESSSRASADIRSSALERAFNMLC